MKLAVIGGGGVRVPLLVNGLARSDLPIDEITLWDVDRDRLAVIAPLAARLAGGARLRVEARLAAAVEGASYVFASIRAGGIERRARDEQIALAHGTVGQETVGPAGFAMAMRNVPPMVAYAREAAARAPDAWIINFTNPVGIVTQAVADATGARILGICDTPTELFEEIAHALDLRSEDCAFDYFGLNHLGWVREVYHDGRPQLARLWERPETIASLYRAPLFDVARIRAQRLLPTEYLYFYERADAAVANLTRAGQSRGMAIDALNRRLFAELRGGSGDPLRIYERYLAERDAGYLQIESGAAAPLARSPWAATTGYDRVALQAVRHLHFDTGGTMPLDVVNRGAIADLADDDVVEVPCSVDRTGARPQRVGRLPAPVAGLVRQVKEYERLTARAALSADRTLAVDALARNPLVASTALAARLVAALLEP